jgi:hypothetical protein
MPPSAHWVLETSKGAWLQTLSRKLENAVDVKRDQMPAFEAAARPVQGVSSQPIR